MTTSAVMIADMVSTARAERRGRVPADLAAFVFPKGKSGNPDGRGAAFYAMQKRGQTLSHPAGSWSLLSEENHSSCHSDALFSTWSTYGVGTFRRINVPRHCPVSG
jgi:hypothetical protein